MKDNHILNDVSILSGTRRVRHKDAEFKAFTVGFEKKTIDIVAKINADPTEEGVSVAQTYSHGKM